MARDERGSDLASRLLARDRSAVPDALNLVDDDRPAERAQARVLLDRLELSGGAAAARIGITGAPGAGKSTLLDALVRSYRADGRGIGILAIDPSSQRTRGALLGDRIRVRSGVGDEGVYLRSLAARDRLGGISDATYASLVILASVFDAVFVETVGVGQSEAEIAHLVDTLVLVAQPNAGDTLQFMKAGILELPDVLLVNKSDLGAAAQRTANELAAGLSLAARRSDGWDPPVLLASAIQGTGIVDLVAAMDAHRAHLVARSLLADLRIEGRISTIRATLEKRYGSYGLDRIGGSEGLAVRIREAEDRGVSSLVHSLGLEIEDALRKPS